MNSILVNKFEMNKILSCKGGSVALEKNENKECRLENQLPTQRKY